MTPALLQVRVWNVLDLFLADDIGHRVACTLKICEDHLYLGFCVQHR